MYWIDKDVHKYKKYGRLGICVYYVVGVCEVCLRDEVGVKMCSERGDGLRMKQVVSVEFEKKRENSFFFSFFRKSQFFLKKLYFCVFPL